MHQAALLGEFIKVYKQNYITGYYFSFMNCEKMTKIINTHEEINIFMYFSLWHFHFLKDAQKYGWNVPEDRTLSW